MVAANSPIRSLRFRVADLQAQRGFYEQVLGLEPSGEGDDLVLAAPDGGFDIVLDHRPDAVARSRRSIGLYHVAFLLPDRRSLAETLAHLRHHDVTIEGVADHGVSEALYLSDREGNGIELYRDRSRQAWPMRGEDVAMVTDPLDVDELASQAREPSPPPAETCIGHVHLHVADLAAAEAFYTEGLGLQVRQRDLPGALFLARGDYHHHVGVNTWAGGRHAPAEAVGLEGYTWEGHDETIERLRGWVDEGLGDDGALTVEGPAGIQLRLERAT